MDGSDGLHDFHDAFSLGDGIGSHGKGLEVMRTSDELGNAGLSALLPDLLNSAPSDLGGLGSDFKDVDLHLEGPQGNGNGGGGHSVSSAQSPASGVDPHQHQHQQQQHQNLFEGGPSQQGGQVAGQQAQGAGAHGQQGQGQHGQQPQNELPATSSGRKRTRPVRAIEEEEAPAPSRPPRQKKKPAQYQDEQQPQALAAGAQQQQEQPVIRVPPEARVVQLEQALKDRDAELMRLKQALSSKTDVPGQGNASVITEQELKQAYCSSVQSLKDYVQVSNLTSYDISGKNLPEKITGDIKTLVHTISKVCLQVLKPETPYVLETVSKDINATTQQDWELDKSHWITVIAQLQLSNLQILSILKAREHHLAKMQVLLQERAAIARQAAELTMAATAQAPGMLEDVSNMSVLVQHGYLYFARNALLLHKMTELIKESLLREQKTVMELFLKVLYQVLSPVQAAVFVVEAFPYHCDVLALANVLSMVFKDQGMAGGGGGGGGVGGGMGMDGLDAMNAMFGQGGGMGMGGMDQLMGMGPGAGQQQQLSNAQQMMGDPNKGGGMGGPDSVRLNPFGATAAMAEQQSLMDRSQGGGQGGGMDMMGMNRGQGSQQGGMGGPGGRGGLGGASPALGGLDGLRVPSASGMPNLGSLGPLGGGMGMGMDGGMGDLAALQGGQNKLGMGMGRGKPNLGGQGGMGGPGGLGGLGMGGPGGGLGMGGPQGNMGGGGGLDLSMRGGGLGGMGPLGGMMGGGGGGPGGLSLGGLPRQDSMGMGGGMGMGRFGGGGGGGAGRGGPLDLGGGGAGPTLNLQGRARGMQKM